MVAEVTSGLLVWGWGVTWLVGASNIQDDIACVKDLWVPTSH